MEDIRVAVVLVMGDLIDGNNRAQRFVFAQLWNILGPLLPSRRGQGRALVALIDRNLNSTETLVRSWFRGNTGTCLR